MAAPQKGLHAIQKPTKRPSLQHWQVSAKTMRNQPWRLQKFASELGLQHMVKDLQSKKHRRRMPDRPQPRQQGLFV